MSKQEYRIVDLSRTLTPGQENRKLEIRRRVIEFDETFMHEVDTESHLGTHVEAPAHFYKDGRDVAEVPLQSLVGRAVILDVSGPAITAEVLEKADRGRIAPGDIVLLRNLLYPEKASLTREACEWLAEKGIALLGFDDSLGMGKDKEATREAHDIVMGRGICLLEMLTNLDQITQPEVFLVAAPLKIKGLDSCPVRAFAIEEI
jgi:kynurenine formamidase